MTTTDPVASAAADTYVNQPLTDGFTDGDHIAQAERDAFTAGAYWYNTHTERGQWLAQCAAAAYVAKSGNGAGASNIIRIAMLDAFLAGVEWARGHQENQ